MKTSSTKSKQTRAKSQPASKVSKTGTKARTRAKSSTKTGKSTTNKVSTNSVNNSLDTKTMLQDFLATQKMITGNYNYMAGECMHDNLRSEVLSILQDEHTIQNDIFLEMKERGWYQVKEAPKAQVDTTKKTYSNKPQAK